MRTSDNVDLKRTLYLIDYERCLRMRELETKRRQFLNRRSNALPCNSIASRSSNHTREELKKKIQREKDAEVRHQDSLLKRKADLMDKLKSRRLPSRPKSSKKILLESEDHMTGQGSNESNANGGLPDYKINNKSQVVNLYQRGFDMLKRKKEAARNPFVASVNTILQKLRAQEDNLDASSDPFVVFSRDVLKKYAVDENNESVDGSKIGIGTENDQIEIINMPSSVSCDTDTHDGVSSLDDKEAVDGLDKADYGQTSIAVSNDLSKVNKKPPFKKSPTALDLWATVRKEQATVRLLDRQQQDTKRVASSNSSELTKTGKHTGDQNTPSVTPHVTKSGDNGKNSPDIRGCRLSRKKAGTGKELLNATLSPRKSPENKPIMSTQKPANIARHSSEDTRSPVSLKVSLSSSPSRNLPSSADSSKGRKVKQLKRESSRDKSAHFRTSLANECIEEGNETNTPNTVIVVHEDDDVIEMVSPIKWDQGYRYSISERDNEVNENAFFSKTFEHGEQENNSTANNIAIKMPTTKHKSNEEIFLSFPGDDRKPTENNQTTNSIATEIPAETQEANEQVFLSLLGDDKMPKDDELVECDDCPLPTRVLDSAMSLNTFSEVPSNRASSAVSRAGRSEKRRLSMQTRGSLRALSGVMKEENRRELQQQNENVHPESATYKTIFEALAGAAADADQQTQRLENIRRAGLGLMPADKEFKVKHDMPTSIVKDKNDKVPHRNMRRNTISAPSNSSSADVTDPVYKFLQRRSQSKTMRRHKTLSNVELKLLAHAPGEDLTGRRHSFSSQQSSRRSSSSIASDENFRRMSVSSSPRKAPSDLSVVLEHASVQSQRDSIRSRASSVSTPTRPQSASLSDTDGDLLGLPRETRSYSWAPDVSEIKEWHVLAMELLARKNNGVSKFRTVSHMLQCLGDEYRRETASMMYEELRYCSYLRLPKHQQSLELAECDIATIFTSESNIST